MDEQTTDQDTQTLSIEEPQPLKRPRRYSPPPDYYNYVPQPSQEDKVPEIYRWHDCM